MVFNFRFSVKAREKALVRETPGPKDVDKGCDARSSPNSLGIGFLTENRKPPLTSFHPGGRIFAGLAGKPPRKEDPYMPKESSSQKAISICHTCAPNGDQVGLSHYLMADAKKAK
jgi:hypothetical protein